MAQSNPDRETGEQPYKQLNGVTVGTPDGAYCDMCNTPLTNGDDVLVHGFAGSSGVHITWVMDVEHDAGEAPDEDGRFVARAELTTHVLRPSQLVLTNARAASTE